MCWGFSTQTRQDCNQSSGSNLGSVQYNSIAGTIQEYFGKLKCIEIALASGLQNGYGKLG